MKTVNTPQRAKASSAEFIPPAPISSLPESMEGVSDAEAFDLIENAEANELAELTGNYWKPTPGVHVFKFVAMDVFESKDGPQEAVRLIDRNGATFIAAQSVLVNSLKKVTDFPCFCKIIVGEHKIKGANGDYYQMQVLTFKANADQRL